MASPSESPRTPALLSRREELARHLTEPGLRRPLALVPTMGYLHDGHRSLMREARRRAGGGTVAVSLFVNPTQFAPTEDLARYPRDLEGDLEKCGAEAVDLVYAPPVEEVYPSGFSTWVTVSGSVTEGLCGASRPDHFRGVATVVTKLFGLFKPDLAVFGEKDYQQLQVIRALERDLDLGVEIVGAPTVREPDGLAMSSRNAYLDDDERTRALGLSRALEAARSRFARGAQEGRELVDAARNVLDDHRVEVEYVELVDAGTLERLERVRDGERARLVLAGRVGRTRLIDNASLGG